MKLRLFVLAAFAMLWSRAVAADPARPNIVWILVDDMSPDLSCYGETAIRTPNLDALAASGTRFTGAFVTAPICSISRSALMTGCYQTTIGCQNHRSGSAKYPIQLPPGMKNVGQLLKEAGYHTSNISIDQFLKDGGPVGIAKTDYNFVWDRDATFERTHWADRPAGHPFFVQVQLHGGKNRGQKPMPAWPKKVMETLGSVTAVADVKLPAWLPDDPVIREDWAQYLDCVRYTDYEAGRIVRRLKDAGVLQNTVIFFWTDHGISHVRTKQFLYDGGIHVPLIVAGPGIPAGSVRNDLVEHIDIAAATLAVAGLPRPDSMQARDFFAKDRSPKEYVFAARDRADETVDRIRSVRSARFKYIRNFYPSRPWLQPNQYKDGKAVVQAMRRLHSEGKLNAVQDLIMADTRPKEELYDIIADPDELHNLAADPAHAGTLTTFRGVLEDWIRRTDDHGRSPEPDEVYMNYIGDERPEGGKQKGNPEFEKNIELMRRWAKEKPMEP